MGGAAAGEVASQMAVDSIYDALAGVRAAAARRASRACCAGRSSTPTSASSSSRATTRASAAWARPARSASLVDDTLVVAQIGDSRCYVLRDGKLAQVTKDQSLAWQLIEAGAMTAEEAKAFEHANIILQALGVQERVEVVLSQVSLRRGDIALLCSDGLHGPVSDEEMLAVLIGEPNLQKAGEALIQKALDRDGPDNITVVLARFDGEGLQPPAPEDVVVVRGLRPGRRSGPGAARLGRRSASLARETVEERLPRDMLTADDIRPRRSRTSRRRRRGSKKEQPRERAVAAGAVLAGAGRGGDRAASS